MSPYNQIAWLNLNSSTVFPFSNNLLHLSSFVSVSLGTRQVMLPMDHFPRIIQHLSCTRLLLMALNPSLFPIPLPYLLSFSHGSHHSRLSERFLCTERLLSHCGSVKWGSYLSSLNVSKRIGNQWCIPVHENFSLNLISPPTYLFVHLSLYLTLCHSCYFPSCCCGWEVVIG